MKKWLCHALAPVLVHRPRSQKKEEVVSVRVMREVPHRLVIFLSGASKKVLENGLFCRVDAGARLSLDEKVAVLHPRARIGASNAILKKKWCLYA